MLYDNNVEWDSLFGCRWGFLTCQVARGLPWELVDTNKKFRMNKLARDLERDREVNDSLTEARGWCLGSVNRRSRRIWRGV